MVDNPVRLLDGLEPELTLEARKPAGSTPRTTTRCGLTACAPMAGGTAQARREQYLSLAQRDRVFFWRVVGASRGPTKDSARVESPLKKGKYLDADYRAVIGGEKPVVGKEANVKGLNAASCELRNVSFDDVTMQNLGHDVVVLGYTATQDVVCSGKPLPAKVAVTTLWHKVNGKWTNAAYHESPILK